MEPGLFIGIVVCAAIGLYVQYWTIRWAVGHALRDNASWLSDGKYSTTPPDPQ